MKRYFFWLMVLIILVGMNAVRAEAAPVSYDFSGDFYWGTYAPGGESFLPEPFLTMM